MILLGESTAVSSYKCFVDEEMVYWLGYGSGAGKRSWAEMGLAWFLLWRYGAKMRCAGSLEWEAAGGRWRGGGGIRRCCHGSRD